jgi:hypothetical protein
MSFLLVVVVAEAVGNGVGAPFPMTPQLGEARSRVGFVVGCEEKTWSPRGDSGHKVDPDKLLSATDGALVGEHNP